MNLQDDYEKNQVNTSIESSETRLVQGFAVEVEQFFRVQFLEVAGFESFLRNSCFYFHTLRSRYVTARNNKVCSSDTELFHLYSKALYALVSDAVGSNRNPRVCSAQNRFEMPNMRLMPRISFFIKTNFQSLKSLF